MQCYCYDKSCFHVNFHIKKPLIRIDWFSNQTYTLNTTVFQSIHQLNNIVICYLSITLNNYWS